MMTKTLKLALTLTVLLFIGCTTEESNEPVENKANQVIYLDSNSNNSRASLDDSVNLPSNTSYYAIEYASANLAEWQKSSIRNGYIPTIGLFGYIPVDNKTEIWLINDDATCFPCIERGCSGNDCVEEVLEDDIDIETAEHVLSSDPRISN
jgi:hypothetical protein